MHFRSSIFTIILMKYLVRVTVYLPALAAATEVALAFCPEFATARTLAAETVPRVPAPAATGVVVLLVTVDVSTFLKLR